MYSDDIWNLVYTHKTCNSSKSNILVDEKTIKRLEKRNVELKNTLIKNGILDKQKKELEFSIDNKPVITFEPSSSPVIFFKLLPKDPTAVLRADTTYTSFILSTYIIKHYF